MSNSRKGRKPSTSRVRNVSKNIDNTTRRSDIKDRQKEINIILSGQKAIDEWNLNLCGQSGWDKSVDLNKHFDNIQLNSGMIVQMYRENPVKSISRNKDTGEIVSFNASIRQIDSRKRNTDVPQWVNTPFPVINKGVLMAVSPESTIWYAEQKAKLALIDPEAAEKFIIPKRGDTVYTNTFMKKDTRYYTNKQELCEDFVMNQEVLRLDKFQNLFLIREFDIESIVARGKEDELHDSPIPIDERYIELENTELEKIEEEKIEKELEQEKLDFNE